MENNNLYKEEDISLYTIDNQNDSYYGDDIIEKYTSGHYENFNSFIKDYKTKFNPFGINKEKLTFYVGSKKRYISKTDKVGINMLIEITNKLTDLNKTMINPQKSFNLGKRIYESKENLKNGATWSEKEYNNNDFLYYYTIMKSVQRFTEVWETLVNAHAIGKFNNILKKDKLKIIGLAGGPGYELIAISKFLEAAKKCKIDFDLLSLDLSGYWKGFVPSPIKFQQYDFNKFKEEDDTLLKTADIIIISYAWYMYFRENKELNNSLKKLHEEHNVSIIILERKKNIDYSFFTGKPDLMRNLVLTKSDGVENDVSKLKHYEIY